jgi:mannose-6-phosphate isomerase-like protein (cupin superfamily)
MTPASVKNIRDMVLHPDHSLQVAKELDVESCAIAVIQMPANWADYPAHDHSHDRLEEIYVVLEGSTTITVGKVTWDMPKGSIARVAPEHWRTFNPGPQGASILVIGAPVTAQPAA